MRTIRIASPRSAEIAVIALTFVLTLTLRVWDVSTRFWMLEDQIRDWAIALRPFRDLPLVGPPTHVGGYTIGPAFYWILWAIRVTVGPWFENLPHAGGIGHAILQSGADTLLLVAVWRRTQSVWVALATVVLLATAAFDLALAALVWNPVMGSTLAKIATALVLLGWHRGSPARVAMTAAVAWMAVHVYTGAIFVAVGVFTAILVDPLVRGNRGAVWRNASIVALVVALLQLPYVAHQVANRFSDRAMSAVAGSVERVLSGSDPPELAKSVAGLAGAFRYIQFSPWPYGFAGWLLLACSGILAVRYRGDPTSLAITLLPLGLSIVGYALFLDDLDPYYYLSLMPAAVLTVVLAAIWMPSSRLVRLVGIVLFLGASALVPERISLAATMYRMPEYRVLVDASRKIRNRNQPMRQIRTDFPLPPTSDPEFLYRVLGGRIDRASPWVSIITSNGGVEYRHIGGP